MSFFFFNDTATTEIYTLSLHDALPISQVVLCLDVDGRGRARRRRAGGTGGTGTAAEQRDRKSTRLNSSHSQISYAVFCLKKKKIRRVVDHRSREVHQCARRVHGARGDS